MPTISVIVTAYNQAPVLELTLRSVQAQTFKDFEILLINDGSTDATREVADRFHDPRLQVFSFPNGGYSRALNRGLDRASGAFIAFVDGDDLWTPDKLERQLQALERHPEAGAAYSWTRFIDRAGTLLFSQHPVHFEGDVARDLLLNDFICSGSNVLVRRSCAKEVGGFDPAHSNGADWVWLMNLATRTRFVRVPAHQILYRQTRTSLSSQVDRFEMSARRNLDLVLATAPLELQQLKPRCISNIDLHRAFLLLRETPSPDEVNRAMRIVEGAIHRTPSLFLRASTHTLLLRCALIRLLPGDHGDRIAHALIRSVSSTLQALHRLSPQR